MHFASNPSLGLCSISIKYLSASVYVCVCVCVCVCVKAVKRLGILLELA